MTSRERVLAALNHREPDRIPLDLGATKVTGIHRIAYERLRAALRLPPHPTDVHDRNQQLARVEDDVLNLLGVDVEGIYPGRPSDANIDGPDDAEYTYYTDEWGIRRRMPRENPRYYDIVESPLAGINTPKDVDAHPWPDPLDAARFEGLRERAQEARRRGRAVILGGICPGQLELGLWLRGFEAFFEDLGSNLPLARRIMDHILEIKLAYWERALAECGDLVDVVMEADDLGTQNSMLISPRMYREELKPRHRELFRYIKSRAPVKIFFHSCGSIYPILDDLIEAGIDILNPVQVSAAGMDSARLKAEFGDRLVFWGGGVDTQRILPAGTPAEVKEEVKRRIADLRAGGGFVFNPVHNIQADVPPENVLAMVEALREVGDYQEGSV